MINQLNPSRRQFLSTVGTGAAVGAFAAAPLVLEGCDAQKWISIALSDLPVILQIAESIISIVGAASGQDTAADVAQAQNAAAQAKQALLTAQSLIQQYQASPTGDLLSKIDAALVAAQTNLSSVLSVLHIANPTLQATIAASIGSALTIVVALQALVPPPPTPAPANVTLNRKALSNQNSNAVAIKVAFNEAVTAAGGSAYAIK